MGLTLATKSIWRDAAISMTRWCTQSCLRRPSKLNFMRTDAGNWYNFSSNAKEGGREAEWRAGKIRATQSGDFFANSQLSSWDIHDSTNFLTFAEACFSNVGSCNSVTCRTESCFETSQSRTCEVSSRRHVSVSCRMKHFSTLFKLQIFSCFLIGLSRGVSRMQASNKLYFENLQWHRHATVARLII